MLGEEWGGRHTQTHYFETLLRNTARFPAGPTARPPPPSTSRFIPPQKLFSSTDPGPTHLRAGRGRGRTAAGTFSLRTSPPWWTESTPTQPWHLPPFCSPHSGTSSFSRFPLVNKQKRGRIEISRQQAMQRVSVIKNKLLRNALLSAAMKKYLKRGLCHSF